MVSVIDNQRVKNVLAHKNNQNSETRLRIQIKNNEGIQLGTLVCVDRGLVSEIEIVSDLTAWRKKYMRYFLTQFEATFNRTKSWLENIVIPSNDRLLFVICTSSDEVVGNFGVCNMSNLTGELDNLIRGRKGGDPRLIYYSEIALLSWMFGFLGYEKSSLHVFSNNIPTINLHKSVGFSVVKTHKLTQCNKPDLLRYLVDSPEGACVNFDYLELSISRQCFFDKLPWVSNVYQDQWK